MATILTNGWTPFALLVVWLWISFGLISRLWTVHRNATPWAKISWSIALLFPVFGWIFYAGFFQIPTRTDIPLNLRILLSTRRLEC